MKYYIRCASYKGAVYLAMQFAKHYSNKEKTYIKTRRTPEVKIDDNSFIFIYPGIRTDGMRGIISASEFAKKYFAQK